MKKLIAFMCAIALVCTMTASVLANVSISDLVPTVGEVTVEQEVELPEKAKIIVEPVASKGENWSGNVTEKVVAVNSTEESTTVAELVVALAELPANDKLTVKEGVLEIKDEEGNVVSELNVAEADFASVFSEVYLSDGATVTYDDDGKAISVELSLTYEQLRGRSAEEFQILLINPETGEMTLIDLDPSSFNAETGEITIKFPFLGVFALIEK